MYRRKEKFSFPRVSIKANGFYWFDPIATHLYLKSHPRVVLGFEDCIRVAFVRPISEEEKSQYEETYEILYKKEWNSALIRVPKFIDLFIKPIGCFGQFPVVWDRTHEAIRIELGRPLVSYVDKLPFNPANVNEELLPNY